MASWQKRARLGVALFGIVTLVGVYLALGERRKPAAKAPTSQLAPRVVLETIAGQMERLRGLKHEYGVRSSRSRTFDDGTVQHEDVTIEASDVDGRSFVVSAKFADATKDQKEIRLRGSIRLREGDGFEMTTEEATFLKDTGILRAAGPVAFSKGRMSGSGVGMVYEEHTDILHLERDARVNVGGGEGQKPISFTAGQATLDRRTNVLVLHNTVHVTHGEQTTDARDATARLSENEDLIQFVELRGDARVAGGLGSVSSLTARDIDLDYADDGRTLERASLRGASEIRMNGTDGAPGRSVAGEQLDVAMRADSSLERLTGTGGVTMTLPPAKDAPGRTVRAATLDARAGADGALTGARFEQNVSFEEAARRATSDLLTLNLSDASISKADFEGRTKFTDGDLESKAARASYDPSSGRLELRGRDLRGDPAVADARVTIEAERIDIELESKRIDARGSVRSTLLSAKDGQAKDGDKTTQLPGLLKKDLPAQLTADAVTYDADLGIAVYTGRAWLTQGETEIRAQSIELQQKAGDLVARGSVRSRFLFDEGKDKRRSEGQGEELQYVDAKRTMTYLASSSSAGASTSGAAPAARLTGPEGDLRGRRITLFLAPAESRLERLVAQDDVIAKVDARIARGVSLEYQVSNESYRVGGTPTTPATVEEKRTDGCWELKGRALTFNRSADTMVVKDDQQELRAKWQPKASCQ